MTCTMSSPQSMPDVAVEMPMARARNVPIKAATMPMTMVSQIGNGLAAGNDQSAEGANDRTDHDRGNDARDSHGSSMFQARGRTRRPAEPSVPGRRDGKAWETET